MKLTGVRIRQSLVGQKRKLHVYLVVAFYEKQVHCALFQRLAMISKLAGYDDLPFGLILKYLCRRRHRHRHRHRPII